MDLASSSPLTLGLYVDNVVYFLEDPATEHKFETLLSTLVTIEFMDTVKWFLGTHFQWLITDDIVSVHLTQMGFVAHLVKDNNIHTHNITHNATPYCSGFPINAIPKSDEPNNCPALVEQKRKYQSVVGSIGWLAQSTRPNLVPTHSLLLAYCNKPSHGHWNAALYALHYIHSKIDYGFTFTSNS